MKVGFLQALKRRRSFGTGLDYHASVIAKRRPIRSRIVIVAWMKFDDNTKRRLVLQGKHDLLNPPD